MRLRMLTVALTALLPLALVGPLPAQADPTPGPAATASAEPTRTPELGAHANAPSDLGDETACVAQAKAATTGQWVCQGDIQFTYTDAKGEVATQKVSGARKVVSSDLRNVSSSAKAAAGSVPVGARAVGDDWDNWCEPTGACTRVLTDQIAEWKSNDYYGVGGVTYGSFDEIWRQSFSAMRNRYRISLIWDLGYSVDPNIFHAKVRYYKVGPDGYAGEAVLLPGDISVNGQQTIYPSKTTFRTVNRDAHNRTTTHHDDLYGDFYAADRHWTTTTVHLPDFKCPRGQCRYHD